MTHPELSFSKNCHYGEGVIIMPFTNLYDSEFGDGVFIGPFVEIGGAKIGARTKISSHSYICPLVEIGADCFIAHGVKFCNDDFTSPTSYDKMDEVKGGWTPLPTKVGNSVRIGSGAVLLPGISIGDHAVIGAGAVVTKDVPSGETWIGTAAHIIHTKLSQLREAIGPQEKVTRMRNSPDLVEKPSGDIFLGSVKISKDQMNFIISSNPNQRDETFLRDTTPSPC